MRTHAIETCSVDQDGSSSGLVVLSTSLAVLYADPGGTVVLRSLRPATIRDMLSTRIPPLLAYLADGILKAIDIRRMQHTYAPFGIKYTLKGPTRTWYCQAFGLPSRDEIDKSRIVLLFSDRPPNGNRGKMCSFTSTEAIRLDMVSSGVDQPRAVRYKSMHESNRPADLAPDCMVVATRPHPTASDPG
jgi:hypothetical protein